MEKSAKDLDDPTLDWKRVGVDDDDDIDIVCTCNPINYICARENVNRYIAQYFIMWCLRQYTPEVGTDLYVCVCAYSLLDDFVVEQCGTQSLKYTTLKLL